MTLTEQQITDNYKTLRKIINDTFSGLRLDKLNHMYDDLEDRTIDVAVANTQCFGFRGKLQGVFFYT